MTLPPRERLVALVLAMWDGVREEEAVWRLLLGEALRGDETAAAVGREILDALAPALRDWLAALFTEPDGTPSLDPEAVATVLVSAVFSFFIGQLFRPAATREAAARHDAEALATLALAARRRPERRLRVEVVGYFRSPMLFPTSARVVTSAGSGGSVYRFFGLQL